MRPDPLDSFDAEVVVGLDRATVWDRLTARPLDGEDNDGSDGTPSRLWLPGFDTEATVTEVEEGTRLEAVKDEEPCRGTDIVVTLTDHERGTTITVVQSGFGDWLPARYDAMSVGWRQIVDDLTTYLATGVEAGRHLRSWPDFGAEAVPADGGLALSGIRRGSLADGLGLREDDLLLVLAGAPVSSTRDLDTVLRAVDDLGGGTPTAEWIRAGELHRTDRS